MATQTEKHKRPRNVVRDYDADYISLAVKHFKKERDDHRIGIEPNFNQVEQRAAAATGWSVNTIKIHKNHAEKNTQFSLLHTGEKQSNSNMMDIERDKELEVYWARVIRDILRLGWSIPKFTPTVSWIMDEINRRHQTRHLQWPWSEKTLRRFMLIHGFDHRRRANYYECVRQKESVRLQRDRYVTEITEYRENGYEIVFSDETWGSQNMHETDVWHWDGDYDENYEKILEEKIKPPPVKYKGEGKFAIFRPFRHFYICRLT